MNKKFLLSKKEELDKRQKNGEKEKSSDLEISCSTQFLKENILQLIKLQGKEVKLECEYVFLHNKYQLIKVL